VGCGLGGGVGALEGAGVGSGEGRLEGCCQKLSSGMHATLWVGRLHVLWSGCLSVSEWAPGWATRWEFPTAEEWAPVRAASWGAGTPLEVSKFIEVAVSLVWSSGTLLAAYRCLAEPKDDRHSRVSDIPSRACLSAWLRGAESAPVRGSWSALGWGCSWVAQKAGRWGRRWEMAMATALGPALGPGRDAGEDAVVSTLWASIERGVWWAAHRRYDRRWGRGGVTRRPVRGLWARSGWGGA
jgi:hypothetical protein